MPARCSGFSMMEVLMSMLVIGTGALAMVMLQLHALRSSQESSLHAAATLMAEELADLRAASATSTTMPGGNDPYLFSLRSGKAFPARADCQLQACSAATFADAALAEWSARLVRDFPEARATVCRDAQARPQERWSCDGDASAPVVLKMGWRRLATGKPAGSSAPLLTLVLGR